MFPNYKTETRTRKFLWWTWEEQEEVKDGWEDLGPMAKRPEKGSYIWTVCGVCQTHANVLKEDGINKTRLFCPRCLSKLTTEE